MEDLLKQQELGIKRRLLIVNYDEISGDILASLCDLTRNLATGQSVNLDTDLAVLKRDYDGIVSNIRSLASVF